MKWFERTVVVLWLGIGVLVADRSINCGLTVGYYGELNKLTAALESLPGVSIDKARSGYNPDVTLEEIWFWLKDSQGRSRYVGLSDIDPIRKLSGQRLAAALAKRLGDR